MQAVSQAHGAKFSWPSSLDPALIHKTLVNFLYGFIRSLCTRPFRGALGVSIRNAASPALNVITHNQFQTFHNTKRNLIGSVTIGGILDGLQGHADAMLNLYSNVVLPSILPPTGGQITRRSKATSR